MCVLVPEIGAHDEDLTICTSSYEIITCQRLLLMFNVHTVIVAIHRSYMDRVSK